MQNTMCELFSGIGGFRMAFNHIQLDNDNVLEKSLWDIVYANQWEPKVKRQSAFKCYQYRFGKSQNYINQDIRNISIQNIPQHTVLTASLPLSKISSMHSRQQQKMKQNNQSLLSSLLEIIRIKRPPFVLIESVDRILCPTMGQGISFPILLKILSQYGYVIEWRVINAADYGFAQRRRRLYIIAINKKTQYSNIYHSCDIEYRDLFFDNSFFAKTFRIQDIEEDTIHEMNINSVSNNINQLYCLGKTGYCANDKIFSLETIPEYIYPIDIKEILENNVSEAFFLTEKQTNTLKNNKEAKAVATRVNNISSVYTGGSVSFPDDLEMPARTLTSFEGTVNRSAHVILDEQTGRYRFLTPIECERLQMIPDNWTNILSKRQRYFVLGNSLVVGVAQKMADALYKIIQNED